MAEKLKSLGVKGTLIKAARLGYITELTCGMPKCFCPEELGGAAYFEPRTHPWTDWEPTSVADDPVGLYQKAADRVISSFGADGALTRMAYLPEILMSSRADSIWSRVTRTILVIAPPAPATG